MSDLLETNKRAVEATVERSVTHRESVAVVETFRGQPVWAGMVEVFDVAEPPPAVAYGWAVESDQGPQYVTVKGEPPELPRHSPQFACGLSLRLANSQPNVPHAENPN